MFAHIINTTKKLINEAAHHANLTEKPKIVLGLSGGSDSVFLMQVLKVLHDEQHIQLIAAHLDHGWRPESTFDTNFCKELCEKLNIQFVSAKAQELQISIKFNGSKEEVGRRLRRYFFMQILHKYQAHFIALAHHLDDQQETFFMRLMRGTTLNGLVCMKDIDGVFLRPLLHITKQQIINHLASNNISYITDPTNLSDDFLRNRIRKYLMPALRQCDQRFGQKFESTLQHIKAEDLFLQKLTEQSFSQIFSFDPLTTCYKGDLKSFLGYDRSLQQRIIILWLITEKVPFTVSSSFINEILRFLCSPQGGNHRIGLHVALFKKQNSFWIVIDT